MILFLSRQESIEWAKQHHTQYVNNTMQCPVNRKLRKYQSVESFCEHIQAFTNEEMNHIQQAVQRIRQRCWTWRHFMHTPQWTFIAVDNHIDGGMPHTIHSAIVLPLWIREVLCKSEQSNTYQNAIETLIHEQIHCLQKQNKQAFEQLYASWGYEKLSSYPEYQSTIQDIQQNYPIRTNPDTPQEWILNKTWYQTVIFRNQPQSLTDVSYVLIPLSSYEYPYDKGHIMNQTDVKWFTEYFGHTNHCYHPDETSAVLLSKLIMNDYTYCMANDAQHYYPVSYSPAEETLLQWVHHVLLTTEQ